MSILLVTRSDDNDSVRMVADALRHRGETPVRLNTDLYPESVRISTRYCGDHSQRILIDESGKRFDLGDMTALWYRRFFAGGSLPADLGDMREPSVNEARRTLYGVIAAMGCFELDPLTAVRKTDHKELQLKLAHAHGLDTPRTLFTNDPAEALRFYEELGGRVVTKMQSSFAIYRGDEEMVVFTNPVKPEDLRDLSGLRYCPMTFQERVEKRLELRATVVGRMVFTSSIDSQRSEKTSVDWRRDGIGLIDDWKPYTLPRLVEEGLLAVMEEFGLNYGAADFIVNPEGRHVFLEINAGGEWFWLQRNPGLPIAEALASVLAGVAPRASARRSS
ncbi:MAG: MvdC/MvdD family ATP grasp protein [Bryobacteraceae bacterium]